VKELENLCHVLHSNTLSTAYSYLKHFSYRTTAYLYDEILVTVVTPSASAVASFVAQKSYTTLVLPSTFALYASVGVTTTASTTALSVQAFGGAY
jgi:hypothetical protein